MDNGGMPVDWKPSPPSAIGSLRWKREVIENSLNDKSRNRVNKSWDCGEMGVFVSIYSGSGWSSYWITKENTATLPEINWEELVKMNSSG